MTMLKLIQRARRDQRGSGTAELAIIAPLLFLLFLLIAQFALYMHAAHVARAAAAQGLSSTRVLGGSAGAGAAAGERTLEQLGSRTLRGATVSAQRGPAQASVQVHGKAVSVVPFLSLAVHAEAIGPVEKFTPAVSP
ncbi:TadE/TadG family type IV pilus assembly protein [Lentzea sp. BCCO 10_0856]|uniref:TadE/TadG family type IV pilus assembly protein n=1 Tax=Lentzea miocenica TaxID=3095431 RepID=A0ABU4T183_9PSEU|nr:TadE/TadG family type IV pilus assembly protein [Lentzea sp. BCCO 10_0856]MDX8031718.1 TadE/TadG family type IV pilus assembly protein [Lentzea sp. BCCO 10_0856]